MNSNLLEQVIMGEISGKYAAIHTYDGILWKVRVGFLTLVFAGWAILLKGMAEGSIEMASVWLILASMFLVNLVLSIGGWFVDRNYVRRKFRVILCLNKLMVEVHQSNGGPGQIPVELLKVSGDDGDQEYESSGYRQALFTGSVVYFVPPFLITAMLLLIWWLKPCGVIV